MSSQGAELRRPHQFISELKHLRVLHSLAIWGVVAFGVLQVYEPVMHGLHAPSTRATGPQALRPALQD